MQTQIFTDQMGREISIPEYPKRIISIVPSQTELLFDLGLGNRVLGLTKFCVHPANIVRDVVKVGGTKNLNIQKIRDLKPDLIIGNKEENEQSQIELLEKEFPVWMSDIQNLDEACWMIRECGNITGTSELANTLSDEIKLKFQSVSQFDRPIKVAYFIWKDPYMAAGQDTFINDMLQRIGLSNIVLKSRYPEINVEELKAVEPALIFLSSEPYPFKEKHCNEFAKLFPDSLVRVVDGEMFSWYGSRLNLAADYFKKIQVEIRTSLNK